MGPLKPIRKEGSTGQWSSGLLPQHQTNGPFCIISFWQIPEPRQIYSRAREKQISGSNVDALVRAPLWDTAAPPKSMLMPTLNLWMLSHMCLMSSCDYLIFLGLIIFLYVSLSPPPPLVHLSSPYTILSIIHLQPHSSLLAVGDLAEKEKEATSPGCPVRPTELLRTSMCSLRTPPTSGLFSLLMSLGTKEHWRNPNPTPFHANP